MVFILKICVPEVNFDFVNKQTGVFSIKLKENTPARLLINLILK